jgi:hypothetical protein
MVVSLLLEVQSTAARVYNVADACTKPTLARAGRKFKHAA